MRKRLNERRDFIFGWIQRAAENRQHLLTLMESVSRYQIKVGGSDREAMVRYDQQRLNKDLLLEHCVNTCIETENAIRMMAGVIRAIDFLVDDCPLNQDRHETTGRPSLQGVLNGGLPMVSVFAALVLRDAEQVELHFDELIDYLSGLTPLYVPLAKGGNPVRIVDARVLQSGVLSLLRQMPVLGLFAETHRLTRATLEMERNNPIGGGAVTEFDGIFEVAYTAKVEALVKSTAQFKENRLNDPDADVKDVKTESQQLLFDCIKILTESMLPMWLEHSKTLRLSVLEKVRKPAQWGQLVRFIKTYGNGLFTQAFFHLGNIRAILHQGVDRWLEQVENSPSRPDIRLLDELGVELQRSVAVKNLTLILESVRENFNEYVDYNSTTTQSDRGDSLDSFLDFLRLRSRYDRICWHLKPVVWAHRILVKHQANAVARMWRRSLNERVGKEADRYLELLQELRNKYSVRMNSVGRRLEGRFAHQLQIDRLRSLVAPAMAVNRTRESERAFELLQHEAQAFLKSTNGVGVDLPECAHYANNQRNYQPPVHQRPHRHSTLETSQRRH